jgi:cellobiose-specific phosphotransferase system component IIC
MSRSSVASRPSFAGSDRLAALSRFADLPFLAATREALPWSFAALLAAFVVLLFVVHVPGPVFSSSLGLRVAAALIPGFGIMGLILAPVLGWRYAVHAHLSPVPGALSALLGYAILVPPVHGDVLGYLRAIGPSGLFLALIAGGAFALAARICGKAWLGAAVVVVAAVAMRLAHVDVSAAIAAMLEPLGRLGDTYAALLAIVLVETLLWCIGMHGPALLAAVVTPVYLTLQAQNTQAFAHHLPMPHIVVVSLFLFVFPGGAGATLPLAALFSVSKVPRLRTVGRSTLVPALFNVNEPLLFAAPVVLNPYLVVPFIVAPLVLATTTYVAVSAHLVGRAINYVPSSIPTVVSTYLATYDVRAVLLALVNIVLAGIIYFPFVRAYERHAA